MGGLTQATNHCSCNCCESRQSLFCYSVKSRHFKLGHLREVNRRKEVDRLSCESEGQVARDINWESGPGRDLKIFWRRPETASLCKQTGRLPWACQPLPVPGIQPPAQCSIVPHQPTHSFWRNATNFANINYSDWYCADISAGYNMQQSYLAIDTFYC